MEFDQVEQHLVDLGAPGVALFRTQLRRKGRNQLLLCLTALEDLGGRRRLGRLLWNGQIGDTGLALLASQPVAQLAG